MIKIICVGKLKEKFWVEACNEYLKRLTKYHKVTIIELKDSDILKEKEEILKHIDAKNYLITMEIEGQMVDSITLGNKIEHLLSFHSNITFLIGGSEGIHEDIKKMANESLSFSKLTFPHQLFRVVLLEQIYRSFKIINHETYHK